MVYISSTSRLAERCELLKKYDLDYHREKRGFICGTCAHFIVMAGVQSHLRGHKLYMQNGEELELQRVYNPLQGDERIPVPGAFGPAVDGLRVVKGFVCSVEGCRRACRKIGTMKKHIGSEHKGVLGAYGEAARVQKLYASGLNSSFFAVDEVLGIVGEEGAYAIFMKGLRPGNRLVNPVVSEGANDMPPLLNITQWHHLNPVRRDRAKREKLVAALELPGGGRADKVTSGVKAVLMAYYEEVRRLVRPIEQVLKRMMLEYPP